MCTVSWVHEGDGFHVLFNRDEKRTRSAGSGPRLQESDGVRYIAPRDGDFGGTWIAANEYGVALCLLNGANVGGVPQPGRPFRSRGHLAAQAIAADSAAGVCHALCAMDLSAYAPFTVAVLEPGLPATVLEWSGSEVVVLPYGDPFMPLLSSSFDTDSVRRERRAQFHRTVEQAGRLDAATLWSFHSSHHPRPSAYSACMHRSDAETVSFTWLKVDENSVRLFYSPGPPCRWNPGEELVLPRT